VSKRAADPPVPAALAPHVEALREYIMPATDAARTAELTALRERRNLTAAERRQLVAIFDASRERADNAGRWIGSRLWEGLLASQVAYLRALVGIEPAHGKKTVAAVKEPATPRRKRHS
jgi:hypothetical protein